MAMSAKGSRTATWLLKFGVDRINWLTVLIRRGSRVGWRWKDLRGCGDVEESSSLRHGRRSRKWTAEWPMAALH
jgi:hypothetical protein